MTVITPHEKKVLDRLARGLGPTQIARELSIGKGNVAAAIEHLIASEVIERKARGEYQVLISNPTVGKQKTGPKKGSKNRPKDANGIYYRPVSTVYVVSDGTPDQVQPVSGIDITPQQAAYIRQHAGTKPRSQMARELGVDKVTLNLMIMQLKGRSG